MPCHGDAGAHRTTPTHVPTSHCREKCYHNLRATVAGAAGKKALSEVRLSRLGRRSSHGKAKQIQKDQCNH